MRVHITSVGLVPGDLRAGYDLVIRLDERHALDLPAGVLADDYLSVADRVAIDEACQRALAEWRAANDAVLTVDGVCLPHLWELTPVGTALMQMVRAAAGARNAITTYGVSSISLLTGPQCLSDAVMAATRAAGASVDKSAYALPVSFDAGTKQRIARKPLRGRVLNSFIRIGVPSRLHPESVLVVGHWSLMPFLDRMLESAEWRPAVHLDRRPVGMRRTLQAATQGGWVGTPGPLRLLRAQPRVAAALARASEPPPISVLGMELGPAIHREFLREARARGSRNLAQVAGLRAAFARQKPRLVVLWNDSTPEERLLALVAREYDVPVLVVAHGGYAVEAIVPEFNDADEVALWSDQAVRAMPSLGRNVHIVGYPRGKPPSRTSRTGRGDRPRIIILAQVRFSGTALVGDRLPLNHYTTALTAIRAVRSRARVVLRPHPSGGLELAEDAARRFPDLDVTVNSRSDIVAALEGVDLCIGSLSTATLESAWVGVPTILLDLTGARWPWPLCDGSGVPLARNHLELAGHLESILDSCRSSVTDSGRTSLLNALGADIDDPTGTRIRLAHRQLRQAPSRCAPPNQAAYTRNL